MNDTPRDYTNRLKRYDNIDGTPEMFMGLMFLGFALAECLELKLTGDAPRWMHGVVIYGVLIPVLAVGYWFRSVVKNHITWPRTGYAAYPRRGGKSWWIGLVTTFFAALVFGLALAFLMKLAGRHHVMSLPHFAMLIVIMATYAIWVFRMSKEHWWKWLLLLLMVLGVLTLALTVPENFNKLGWPVLLFIGLVWLGSGAGTLCSYIRHTQPPASQAE